MSAICGVIGVDGRPVSARDLAGVLDALRAFGPDAETTWEGTAGRTAVALGARGGQPVRSVDGAVSVVADAALDCVGELGSRLGVRPAASDAELILAAYERWGERCLEELSGDFAFAVADARRGGVLVARDQMGIRPLALHHANGLVAFATTALALCGLEGVGHELDRVQVGEWLALVQTERSFVAGVSAFPAGHCTWIDAGRIRRRRYWTIDPHRFVELGSPEAYAGELRAAFDSAVERRLPDDGRVGALLSGGLDSTSVAATAARLRPNDSIRTYTAAPPEGWSGPTAPLADADESSLVRELASRYANLLPGFLRDGLGPPLASHDARFAAGSPPARNPCNELWMLAAQRRAAADGVATLLAGTRGNTFFSGDDPFWLAALLVRGRFAHLRRELAALPSAGAAARELGRQLLPSPGRRLVGLARARRAGVSEDDRLHFAGPGTAAVVHDWRQAFDPPTRRSLRERALEATPWTGYPAEVAAVRAALTGVRMSDPTTDVRVIAVCAAQPPWVRRRDGRDRAVVRDAMSDRLPPSIVERTRRGAQLPNWLDHFTAWREELLDELEAARSHAVCRDLLDLDRIDRALRDWPDAARLRDQFTRTTQIYRYDLPRALLMSRYLRFFEAHAAEHRARPVRR